MESYGIPLCVILTGVHICEAVAVVSDGPKTGALDLGLDVEHHDATEADHQQQPQDYVDEADNHQLGNEMRVFNEILQSIA